MCSMGSALLGRLESITLFFALSEIIERALHMQKRSAVARSNYRLHMGSQSRTSKFLLAYGFSPKPMF